MNSKKNIINFVFFLIFFSCSFPVFSTCTFVLSGSTPTTSDSSSWSKFEAACTGDIGGQFGEGTNSAWRRCTGNGNTQYYYNSSVHNTWFGSYGSTSDAFNKCSLAEEPCPVDQTWNPSTRACEGSCPLGSHWDSVSQSCVPDEQQHECVIPENPATANCYFRDDAAMDCIDGSYVYPPMLCPSNTWDSQKPPGPGEYSECSDGTTVTYPDSCLSKYMKDIGVPDLDELIDIVLGTQKLKLINGVYDSMGNPVVRAVQTLAKQLSSESMPRYTQIEADVPIAQVGKAMQDYLKNNPNSPYLQTIVNELGLGPSHTPVQLDPATGQIKPYVSTVPWSPGQLARTVLSLPPYAHIPLTELAPYIQPELIPWLQPAIPAIDGEYQRIYDPAGYLPPIHFPNLAPNLSTGLSPYESLSFPPQVEPFQLFTPNSPISYSQPTASPTTLADPKLNSNPDGTDTIIYNTTINNITQVDPQAIEAPPEPPTIYPDTWKYFNFLPMTNPFVLDPASFLPELPSTSCSYEIHKTFHVPYLGTKNFDVAPCVPLQPLRDVLQWAFGVLTLMICFYVVFRSNF